MRNHILSLLALLAFAYPLCAEPALFPAKNALALTVTEDGLVLEGADLVTPDLDNWEVSWPAVLADNGTLVTKTETLGINPIIPYLALQSYTTRTTWAYGDYHFRMDKRKINATANGVRYTVSTDFYVYHEDHLIKEVNLDYHNNMQSKHIFSSLSFFNSDRGHITKLRKTHPDFTNELSAPRYDESLEVSIYTLDGGKQTYATQLYTPSLIPTQEELFSNTKRLYSFYPRSMIADPSSGRLILDTEAPYGIYSHSDTEAIFSSVEPDSGLLSNWDITTLLPYDIVDDGADAIIFEKRVYTKDNGQTWTYYDAPLPADYLSYDEGYFEYITLPTEENDFTYPIRKRSADKGATWEEVENHARIGDYGLSTEWNEEAQTSVVIMTHPSIRYAPLYLEDWWILDVHTFQDTFVVLLKHANDMERAHQLLCLPVDNSPLRSSEYSEQMLWDGHWQVEVVREPKVRLTEEDADSAELLDVSYENLAQIHLGYPTGRVENVIYGQADIESYPWVYSYELGWHAYFTSNDAETPGAFLWTPEESWLFTCVGYYPFIWSYVEENWIWVDVGEGRTRQWYLYQGDGNWIQVR